MGVPFKSADEVKECLYLLLLSQEIVQFMQFYCKTWGIQIAGNKSFQVFCYRLLDQSSGWADLLYDSVCTRIPA